MLVLHRHLLDRRRRLLTDNIDALREATRLTQTRHPFTIDAMVVLPDHIHAVWTLPPGDADFSLRWRLIKIASPRPFPRQSGSARSASHAANAPSGSVDSGNI
jgi:putative transposase